MTADAALEVVGPGTTAGIAVLAEEFHAAVAAFLGLPPRRGASVYVHGEPGISRVLGRVVHLYRGPMGEPDVDQLPHELVHLVAGLSPCRLLSEGLAVHCASRLGLAQPCWPSYRLSPDLWVAGLRTEGSLPSVSEAVAAIQVMHLSHSDGTTAVRRAAGLYLVAGSFTGHLFRTMERYKFWAGYRSGACWDGPEHLTALETTWLGELPTGLDTVDRQRLAASLDDARQQLDSVAGRAR